MAVCIIVEQNSQPNETVKTRQFASVLVEVNISTQKPWPSSAVYTILQSTSLHIALILRQKINR